MAEITGVSGAIVNACGLPPIVTTSAEVFDRA